MPSRRNPHRNSLNRFLFTSQTHPKKTSLPSLTSLLLSQSSWHTLSPLQEPQPPQSPSPHECFPILFNDSETTTLELLHHPSCATISYLPNIGQPHYVNYRPTDGCVAISLSWQGLPAILFSPLFEDPIRLWAAGGLDGTRVRSVCLAPSDIKLAACVGPYVVLYAAAPGDAFLRETHRLADPDRAQGAVARYVDENVLVSGTSSGQVRCWDLRAGDAPVWSFDPSGSRLYIRDIRGGDVSGDLYVNCELASSNALAAWDVRTGGRQGPKQVFERQGWGESLVFDVVEQGGLVVGGGSDRTVAMWDCWKGGQALRRVGLDEEIKLVRLMGLSGKGSGSEGFGMFVVGEFETVFSYGC